jgi:Uma2 family endonuclease
MNAPFRTPAEQAPERHRFTVDDIYRMQDLGLIPPDSRFELLDGEIIDMPAEGEAHIRMRGSRMREVESSGSTAG